METYAAMIHEMDAHTGRLIEFFRATEQLDNTVIVFLSDNGAEGHTYEETWPEDLFPQIRANIDNRHDFSFDSIGRPGSYTFRNAEWARVSAPSSKSHKDFPTDGGLRVPAFIYFPRQIAAKIAHSPVFIKDIAPTLLELLDIKPKPRPDKANITGVSFLPLLQPVALTQEPLSVAPEPRIEISELFGKVAVIEHPWRAVRLPTRWKRTGERDWTLCNLENDNLELTNLAAEQPEKLSALLAAWSRYKN